MSRCHAMLWIKHGPWGNYPNRLIMLHQFCLQFTLLKWTVIPRSWSLSAESLNKNQVKKIYVWAWFSETWINEWMNTFFILACISEPAHNTGHHPLWNEVKFIDCDPHWHTHRVKEAIHIILHPNNIDRANQSQWSIMLYKVTQYHSTLSPDED